MNPITREHINSFITKPTHAVALTGPSGAGKLYAAQLIGQQLLDGEKTYLRELDGSKVGIDEVRSLQSFLALTVPGRRVIKRVVIVDAIDSLGHEAQNALLKMLEEPPKDTVFIVTYSHGTLVLPTIRSRVQELLILPISFDQAAQLWPGQDITRAYHISSGYVGLLHSLMKESGDHALLRAVTVARELLGQSRFERLARVDVLAKDTDIPPKLLIDAMYRLVYAGYQQALSHGKSNSDLEVLVKRLQLLEQTLRDLQVNVQSKLLLGKLFYEF